MAEFTLQALNDEIDNDPEAIGYKTGATWKGDQEIADLINAKNYTIDRASIPSEDVRAAVTYGAYNNLSIDEQEWIRWMTPGGSGETGQFKVTADMKLQLSGRTLTTNGTAGTGNDNSSFWAAANRAAMAPAMLALIEVPGSRAEVLWDEDRIINPAEVGAAANL